jgi:hypothetical protein
LLQIATGVDQEVEEASKARMTAIKATIQSTGNLNEDEVACLMSTEPVYGLTRFLNRFGLDKSDLNAENDREGRQRNGVLIMLSTIHSSKGLEFPEVVVVGVERGSIPHTRAMKSPSDVEEERRLLYVAMTRAKEKLTLTYKRRNKEKITGMSQFLVEMDQSDMLEAFDFKGNPVRWSVLRASQQANAHSQNEPSCSQRQHVHFRKRSIEASQLTPDDDDAQAKRPLKMQNRLKASDGGSITTPENNSKQAHTCRSVESQFTPAKSAKHDVGDAHHCHTNANANCNAFTGVPKQAIGGGIGTTPNKQWNDFSAGSGTIDQRNTPNHHCRTHVSPSPNRGGNFGCGWCVHHVSTLQLHCYFEGLT